MKQLLVNLLVAGRFPVAAATLLVAGIVAFGMQFTSLDPSSRGILIEDDPIRAEVEEVREDFPAASSVMYVFQTDTDVFNLTALGAMQALTDRYTEVEHAIAVGSLMNRRLNSALAERLDRDYLVPELGDLDAAELAAVKQIALDDEELTKSLLSREGDLALAVIKFRTPDDEQSTRLNVARSAVALRNALREAYPGVEIYVLGNVTFELDGYNAQIKDSQQLFPLVIGISVLLLWYCLRSLPYALCLFVVSFITVGVTTGTYGWLDIALNQISSLGPLVVFVIAMADGIHVVAIYAQGLHDGKDKISAMRESLAVNLQPISLATVTTAMGFLSLNFSSSPGIYGFGNIVAIGVVWAFIVTLGLLPALILLLPANRSVKPLAVQGFIVWVDRLITRRTNLLFWGGAALVAVTLALLPMNKLDFNRYNFIDEESDFHQVIDALANKIGNDQSLVYSIESGDYYGITELDFLYQVDAFSQWLEAQPEASFVASYTDYLRAMNKAEHDDDEAWEVLPQDKLQIIDYLVSYQLIQEIEPNLEAIFNSDYSAIRLVVGTSNLTNLQLLEFNERIDQWLADNLDARFRVLHGDNSILFARLNFAITKELVQGFSLSFVLITLTMLVGLRSVRYGLISTMPNLFPATIVFGIWGLFVGELSPYILMLFSISIGLVVDDSVHILSKYITARKAGESPENAVSYSLDKAGSAITITTVSLAVGTFILVFSNTFHFQNVALLLTPIIVVALLLDLFVLPPLLIRFDRRRAAP